MLDKHKHATAARLGEEMLMMLDEFLCRLCDEDMHAALDCI